MVIFRSRSFSQPLLCRIFFQERQKFGWGREFPKFFMVKYRFVKTRTFVLSLSLFLLFSEKEKWGYLGDRQKTPKLKIGFFELFACEMLHSTPLLKNL